MRNESRGWVLLKEYFPSYLCFLSNQRKQQSFIHVCVYLVKCIYHLLSSWLHSALVTVMEYLSSALSMLHSELRFQFVFRDNQDSELLNQIKPKLKKI